MDRSICNICKDGYPLIISISIRCPCTRRVRVDRPVHHSLLDHVRCGLVVECQIEGRQDLLEQLLQVDTGIQIARLVLEDTSQNIGIRSLLVARVPKEILIVSFGVGRVGTVQRKDFAISGDVDLKLNKDLYSVHERDGVDG